MLVAMHSTAGAGGAITAVLIGVPGGNVNAATVLDGYPLAKKGKAARVSPGTDA
jgi:putative tricarboxylic transport membrane protein